LPFDIQNLTYLAQRAYLANVRRAFGEGGEDGIRRLLDAVRLTFQRCPPESLSGTLIVVCGIGASPLNPIISTLGALLSPPDYATLGTSLFSNREAECHLVEICSDGTLRCFHSSNAIDPKGFVTSGVVYVYRDGVDRILAKDFDDVVPKVSPMLKSTFATPTLSDLEAALQYYGRKMAVESQCRILADIWEEGVDGPRLVLVNKPESVMRNSLAQALSLLIRDTNVRPEQNTDETKPVDIRVEWFGSGASALIEVKWLGKSTAKPRKPTSKLTYTEYGGPRAQEGADQLADYMDRQSRHSGAITAPRGYLVVFDARRLNTKGASDRLTKAEALHFVDEEIAYNPDHSKIRPDFASPTRFFLKPRASWFATA
jgi:hypothetical protein